MTTYLLIFLLLIVFVNLILTVYLLKKLHPVTHSSSSGQEKVLIDTCALIDGRVLELAKTGFLPRELIIPKFVIAELQGLADGRDSLKRQRARYGLDTINELKSNKSMKVTIDTRLKDDELEVDDKLIVLAKQTHALLYTTDYNLNKVAEIEGVTVLNVNELSNMLKPLHLPGETSSIKIVQKGQDKSQGVGYLEDGTMVVVAKAGNKLNKTIKVEFDRHLQTSAGRMMFAKLTD